MNRTKLVFFVTGIGKDTGKPYYRATFKRLGVDNRKAELKTWLNEEVGARAVQLGLDRLVQTSEPEVKLGFGFGGEIVSIELAEGSDITTQPFDDEVVFE